MILTTQRSLVNSLSSQSLIQLVLDYKDKANGKTNPRTHLKKKVIRNEAGPSIYSYANSVMHEHSFEKEYASKRLPMINHSKSKSEIKTINREQFKS